MAKMIGIHVECDGVVMNDLDACYTNTWCEKCRMPVCDSEIDRHPGFLNYHEVGNFCVMDADVQITTTNTFADAFRVADPIQGSRIEKLCGGQWVIVWTHGDDVDWKQLEGPLTA